MFKMPSNGHILLGFLSLLLTLGFLSYFIHQEYQAEKATIVLESRDEVFKKMFAKIAKESKHEGVDVSAILSELQGFDMMDVDSFSFGSRKPDVFNRSEHSQIFMSDTFAPTENYQIHIGYQIDSSEQHFQQDSLFNFSTIKPKHISAVGIPPVTVLKRIVPQLLVSLMVLLSILLSYILFVQQIKKERRLSQMRNDFMSNMSHELKTPISTISVVLEALSNFQAADNKKLSAEYIDITKHEIHRLDMLVDKALNISLYEQGKFIADKQSVDLDTEIQSVLKILKIQLEQIKVQLNYNKTGQQFLAFVDKTHMVNVVHNLIENAIKYSNEHPIINISLTEHANNLELSITDNGIGINSSYQDKIFDKFFRVPQGNVHNVKGHGLGLSYVKEVISKHEGTIHLKSKEGEGSTFIINLPKYENG